MAEANYINPTPPRESYLKLVLFRSNIIRLAKTNTMANDITRLLCAILKQIDPKDVGPVSLYDSFPASLRQPSGVTKVTY